jgi:uncharacterized protein (DUF433 family)
VRRAAPADRGRACVGPVLRAKVDPYVTARNDIYGGKLPRDVPLYSVADAARIVRLSPATLRTWVLGRRYATRAGERHWDALIRAADPRAGRLSFTNLVELHVLSVLRGRKVRVENIRSATRFIRNEMETEHPLADVDTHTDQVDIYVEYLGRLMNASQSQAALRPVVELYLTRIERNEKGLAQRLFPQTRDTDDLGPKLIVIDPTRRFGRPVVAGTNIETSVIAERFKAGEMWSDLAADFDIDEAAVAEAVRFETELRRAA